MLPQAIKPGDTIGVIAPSDIIEEKDVKNLFERLYRTEKSCDKKEGTGLGLAIVKKVIEQHSGEVFVLNAPSPYTKMFVLSFPKVSECRKAEV